MKIFQNYQSTLDGLSETIRELWAIIENPKTAQKEKIKSISILTHCYDKRFGLLEMEPKVNQLAQFINQVLQKEKDVIRREKALQAYLEGRRLTQREIDLATKEEKVF